MRAAATHLREPLAIPIAIVATVGLVALGHPWSLAIAAGMLVLAVHIGTTIWISRRVPGLAVGTTAVPDWRQFGLTPKEIEVIPLIVSGLSYRQVGRRTFNSERTIENHVDHIKKKLGVHSRAEIIAFAMRQGLLDPADPHDPPRTAELDK